MNDQQPEIDHLPTAYENGWRGFDTAGSVERVEGGWSYSCDGMPHPMGCGDTVTVTRKWARVGTKKSGWFVCYGDDGEGNIEADVVLAFCPSCAAVVRGQGLRSSPAGGAA
jgi:hypothetical protein